MDKSTATNIRKELISKLKEKHCFWSYDVDSITDVPNVVAQGERYHVLNRAFAWYYFGIKRPDRYVKAMETRQFKKRINQ